MNYRKKLTEPEAWNIIKQITLGVKEMTEKHFMHRDLKPANIVLNFPNPKL